MIGDTVIVRGFKDKPYVVRVCGARSGVVQVTGESNYQRLQSGLSAAVPIGVPHSDVFSYNQELYQELLKNWQKDATVWERLELWEGAFDQSEQETIEA